MSDINKNWDSFKKDLPYRKDPYKKRNWGSNLHSLCSFHGKLKPAIVFHLIKTFSYEGDTILDPFCGSGTVCLESSLNNRNSIGFDISKLSVIISNGKIGGYDDFKIQKILKNLEIYINSSNKVSDKTILDTSEIKFNKEIKEYYEKDTLKQIMKARDFFMLNLDISSREWCLIMGSMLHILHGNRPYALSRRSHPITPYAPTGEFIKKSVIEKLKEKISRSISGNEIVNSSSNIDIYQKDILTPWNIKDDTIDMILTSPPFMMSTRFYMMNWLRYWFVGWGSQDFLNKTKDFVENKQKNDINIYHHIFSQAKSKLKHNKYCIIHLGVNEKKNMATELVHIAEQYFKVIDIHQECVENIEKHGIKDQGGTSKHQYMVLKKT